MFWQTLQNSFYQRFRGLRVRCRPNHDLKVTLLACLLHALENFTESRLQITQLVEESIFNPHSEECHFPNPIRTSHRFRVDQWDDFNMINVFREALPSAFARQSERGMNMPRNPAPVEAAYAYLGHFAGNPLDLAIVTADNYQDALDWCDAVGQPDEGSFETVSEPLVLRLRATLEEDDIGDGIFQFVTFQAHPDGALALHGGLHRFLKRHQDNTDTVTGDIMRSYGPACPECGSRHFAQQECRVFLETDAHLETYLVMLNGDPHDVAIVAALDEDEAEEVASRFGEARVVAAVESGVIFNVRLSPDGSTSSDPNVCHAEHQDWMEPLVELLQQAT